jgi:hypothetical protein
LAHVKKRKWKKDLGPMGWAKKAMFWKEWSKGALPFPTLVVVNAFGIIKSLSTLLYGLLDEMWQKGNRLMQWYWMDLHWRTMIQGYEWWVNWQLIGGLGRMCLVANQSPLLPKLITIINQPTSIEGGVFIRKDDEHWRLGCNGRDRWSTKAN